MFSLPCCIPDSNQLLFLKIQMYHSKNDILLLLYYFYIHVMCFVNKYMRVHPDIYIYVLYEQILESTSWQICFFCWCGYVLMAFFLALDNMSVASSCCERVNLPEDISYLELFFFWHVTVNFHLLFICALICHCPILIYIAFCKKDCLTGILTLRLFPTHKSLHTIHAGFVM